MAKALGLQGTMLLPTSLQYVVNGHTITKSELAVKHASMSICRATALLRLVVYEASTCINARVPTHEVPRADLSRSPR